MALATPGRPHVCPGRRDTSERAGTHPSPGGDKALARVALGPLSLHLSAHLFVCLSVSVSLSLSDCGFLSCLFLSSFLCCLAPGSVWTIFCFFLFPSLTPPPPFLPLLGLSLCASHFLSLFLSIASFSFSLCLAAVSLFFSSLCVCVCLSLRFPSLSIPPCLSLPQALSHLRAFAQAVSTAGSALSSFSAAWQTPVHPSKHISEATVHLWEISLTPWNLSWGFTQLIHWNKSLRGWGSSHCCAPIWPTWAMFGQRREAGKLALSLAPLVSSSFSAFDPSLWASVQLLLLDSSRDRQSGEGEMAPLPGPPSPASLPVPSAALSSCQPISGTGDPRTPMSLPPSLPGFSGFPLILHTCFLRKIRCFLIFYIYKYK